MKGGPVQVVFLLLSGLLAGLLSLTQAAPVGATPPYQVSAWTFGDNDSLVKACDRNAHPQSAGIAIWRMGGEAPKFWNEIVRQLR